MRRLILVGILGLALPAFAAEDHAPTTGDAASEQAAPALEAASAEAAPASASESKKANMASEAAVPAAESERAEAVPAPSPIPSAAVARGTFATAIEQREPVDSVTSLESDQDRVYYFNEFVGLSGRRVVHRWEYDGEVVAEVPIEIGGPRWRAYSSKGLDATRLGEWTVSVVDESGHVVQTDSFVYEAVTPEPEVAAQTATSAAPSTTTTTPTATPTTTTTPASPAATPASPEAMPAAPAPADAAGTDPAMPATR